jgi:hypothetical protein
MRDPMAVCRNRKLSRALTRAIIWGPWFLGLALAPTLVHFIQNWKKGEPIVQVILATSLTFLVLVGALLWKKRPKLDRISNEEYRTDDRAPTKLNLGGFMNSTHHTSPALGATPEGTEDFPPSVRTGLFYGTLIWLAIAGAVAAIIYVFITGSRDTRNSIIWILVIAGLIIVIKLFGRAMSNRWNRLDYDEDEK